MVRRLEGLRLIPCTRSDLLSAFSQCAIHYASETSALLTFHVESGEPGDTIQRHSQGAEAHRHLISNLEDELLMVAYIDEG